MCPYLVLGGDGECGGGVDGLQNGKLNMLADTMKGIDVEASQVQ